MTLSIDPASSERLQGLAVFLARSLVFLLIVSYLTPYVAGYYKVVLGDADRALINQIVSADINMLLIVSGFLFGSSLGKRQSEDTINKQADAMKQQQSNIAPLVAAVSPAPGPGSDGTQNVNLEPGQSAKVTAADPSSADVGQEKGT